jgi:plasmid stability protein
MPNVLIRNVPESVLAALRRRAARNRRSLQQELATILESAAQAPDRQAALEAALAIQERLRRSGRVFDDSTADIRADRER